LIVTLALLVCITSSFVSFKPARALVNRSVIKASHAVLPQSKVQPFCKLTLIDHRGHSVKLSTNLMHASHSSITFIFDTGEKLVIKFTTIRAGHFFAESARSRDPQIIFYPAHSSNFYAMVGAVVISSTKPLSGNFGHLMSDDDEVHLNLVSGSFSF
jgi:hypothetical protein